MQLHVQQRYHYPMNLWKDNTTYTETQPPDSCIVKESNFLEQQLYVQQKLGLWLLQLLSLVNDWGVGTAKTLDILE